MASHGVVAISSSEASTASAAGSRSVRASAPAGGSLAAGGRELPTPPRLAAGACSRLSSPPDWLGVPIATPRLPVRLLMHPLSYHFHFPFVAALRLNGD